MAIYCHDISVLGLLPPDCELGATRYGWAEIGSGPAGSGMLRGLSDRAGGTP
jgi:hypothetical protein